MLSSFKTRWLRFWLSRGGLDKQGRMAFRLASFFAPPHKAAAGLAEMTEKGYISPTATIYHPKLDVGRHVFIGENVMVFGGDGAGPVSIGRGVRIFRDTIIDTGEEGSLRIGSNTSIHPRCQINAYKTSIQIGQGVLIAANCAMYPHDHGLAPDRPVIDQPLQTKGPIIIEDDAWLGTGVIVLGGVRIGKGAVVGAGAVVNKDIPENAIAVGLPAKMIKSRNRIHIAQ